MRQLKVLPETAVDSAVDKLSNSDPAIDAIVADIPLCPSLYAIHGVTAGAWRLNYRRVGRA